MNYLLPGGVVIQIDADAGSPTGDVVQQVSGVRQLLLNQDYTFLIFMSDNTGAGVTGLTLGVDQSYNGAAFSTISPTVTERADGWYSVTVDSTDLATEGECVFLFYGSGAENQAIVTQVGVLESGAAGGLSTAKALTVGQFLALK
jgi:hypothetical protein